ncbi:MAG: OmpA family protein [Kiritimatiellia bacterium]|nr:OmpA family protein [Kiritimatiellia bacterium]
MNKTIGVWAKVILVVLLAASVTGCSWFGRKKKVDNNVGGVTGISVDSVEGDVWMGDSRFEGEEVRGQYDVVYFDYDSSQVKASERAKVERVAEAMIRTPSLRIVLEGHADERGSAEYNLALGERRALAIRAYLVGLGVDAARLQTKSLGEEMPVAQGSGEEAWRQNRRGEFVVIR